MTWCPGPTRRDLMKFGSVGLGGMLAGVNPFRLNAAEVSKTTNDPAVIFIWLPGGPPHQETFDLKPDAPSEYRGDFKPIRTNVPGIDICEHLPSLSKMADKFSLIRSVAHTFADHGGGHKKFLTGRNPLEPTGFVNDDPMVGSLAAKALAAKGKGKHLPHYVAGVDAGRQGIDTFSFGSSYLGHAHHPFFLIGDPSEPKFSVNNLSLLKGTEAQLADRQSLLARFDRAMPEDRTGVAVGLDSARGRAFDMLTSPAAKEAFDLSREPQALREKYGDHRYGQRCLMARRLVESGVSWVTMVLENATPRGKDMIENGTYNWDSHAVNCDIFKDTRFKLGFLDQAISALISDLYDRGLNKRVLVVVTGEFGRTPKIEYDKKTGRPGRDHWPQAMSILTSGGGFKDGIVVGSTTSKAETPKDRPLSPNDLWATVFHHLKLDYKANSNVDGSGRPLPMLSDGEPIKELVV
jgi:hypothetical protein